MAPITVSKSATNPLHVAYSWLSRRIPTNTEILSPVRHFPSSILNVRQDTTVVVIPNTYDPPSNTPSPGTVVGIVLGVVLGIAFVLWVLYTVFNVSNPSGATEVEIIKRSPRKSRHTVRSDRTRSEVIEVSRTREPRRAREIIVEEEVIRPPPQDEDDVVVVIEEHSPVRRQRRSSGYRNVDPNEFGGGRRDRRGVR